MRRMSSARPDTAALRRRRWRWLASFSFECNPVAPGRQISLCHASELLGERAFGRSGCQANMARQSDPDLDGRQRWTHRTPWIALVRRNG
jgi:hypothetical protein